MVAQPRLPIRQHVRNGQLLANTLEPVDHLGMKGNALRRPLHLFFSSGHDSPRRLAANSVCIAAGIRPTDEHT